MKTYKLGLIGEKLGHSFSPAIHAKLGTPDYALFELKSEELGPFLKAGNFDGLNVTIPYKKAVIPFCDELTDQAKRIGSVNTIVRRADGTLLGHNTDYDGFLYMIHRAGVEVKGKKCLILGTGGASLTVNTVLQDLEAGEIVFISRTGENHYGNLERHADAQIIVNSTPVGMWPNTGKAPLDVSRFPKLEGVFDLIYNPARTQILLDAERMGAAAVNGLGMLVAQAKAASERFRDIAIPDGEVDRITAEMEGDSKNILLVGMPGCGKSTIGRKLAEKLGRPLVDTDALIVERAGCSIPEIFARDGEAAFRDLEAQVVADTAKLFTAYTVSQLPPEDDGVIQLELETQELPEEPQIEETPVAEPVQTVVPEPEVVEEEPEQVFQWWMIAVALGVFLMGGGLTILILNPKKLQKYEKKAQNRIHKQ